MTIQRRLGSNPFIGLPSQGDAPGTDEVVEVTALEITPDVVAMQRRQSVRAQVVARFADGSSRDVSHEGEAHWSSGDTSVLSVTETGLVIAGAPGVTTVRVEYRGVRWQVVAAVLAGT